MPEIDFNNDDQLKGNLAAGAPEESGAEAEASVEPVETAVPEGPAMNWYIIHTYSGFENKVAESLKARASAYGFMDKVGQVLIPTEEVVELRNGKKVTSKRLLYPGYVMVQIAMDDELWHQVKNTPRVTGLRCKKNEREWGDLQLLAVCIELFCKISFV